MGKRKKITKQSIILPPIHQAAKDNNLEALKSAINADHSTINVADQYGFKPIHYAAVYGDEQSIDIILQYADPNAIDDNGNSALHFAIAFENDEVAKKLVLDENTDLNITNHDNHSPLFLAAYKNNYEIVELLLGNDANAHMDKNLTALHVAAMKGHEDVLVLLIESLNSQKGFYSDDEYTTDYQDNKDDTILYDEDEYTIDCQDSKGNTPLYYASEAGHVDTIELLLANSATFHCSHNGLTPLHIAAFKGNLKAVKLLLDSYISNKTHDINCTDFSGNTALHLAAQNGHFEIVKILLEYGSNMKLKNNDKIDSISMAAIHKHDNISKFMVGTHGLLHSAATSNDYDTVKRLLDNGADVNSQDSNGNTALHYAIRYSHIAIIKYLLICNADINISNRFGYTPIGVAKLKGDNEIISLLKNKDLINSFNQASPLSIFLNQKSSQSYDRSPHG